MINSNLLELLYSLVERDLKARYRGSILGFLWTILTPIFMALIYIIFLRIIGGKAIASQYENILIGVFAWQFTVQCINSGMVSITGNVSLIKKVYFPKIILPLSTVLTNLINFYIALVVQIIVLSIILFFRGESLPLLVLLVPLVTLYHMIFNFALSLFVASANVFFRDTQHLINLAISAWFFLSPVMYPVSLVKQITSTFPVIAELYFINPMSVILTLYRFLQVPEETFHLGYGAIIGLILPFVLFLGSICLFFKAEKYFADVL